MEPLQISATSQVTDVTVEVTVKKAGLRSAWSEVCHEEMRRSDGEKSCASGPDVRSQPLASGHAYDPGPSQSLQDAVHAVLTCQDSNYSDFSGFNSFNF